MWQAALATAAGDERSKGKRVLVFSLEMTREDICQRLAAQGVGIPEARLENGAISEDEYNMLAAWAEEHLESLPIHIVTDCRTIEEMRARVLAELAGPDGVGLVVIDFLQRAKMARRGDDGHRDEQDRDRPVAEPRGPSLQRSSCLHLSQVGHGKGYGPAQDGQHRCGARNDEAPRAPRRIALFPIGLMLNRNGFFRRHGFRNRRAFRLVLVDRNDARFAGHGAVYHVPTYDKPRFNPWSPNRRHGF